MTRGCGCPLLFASGHPVHVCQDCCESPAAAKAKAVDLICDLLLRPAVVPALNKWTKVFPCVGATVLLSSFCNVAKICFDRQFTLSERASSESSDENPEDKALGVPLNEVKKWRKLARKRNEKARKFIGDRDALFSNMLWLYTASPIMNLHWKLFKTETWHCDRPKNSEDQPIRVGQFCTPSSNPALLVAANLMQILLEPALALATMCFFFGAFETWSPERKRMLRRAIVVCLGQLLRKLVQPFLAYPWRLWPLADPAASPNAKGKCCADLASARNCCCDSGCSQRLKAMDRGVLSERAFQDFIRSVFEQVVLTSTFIERKFANFTHWTTQSQGVSALCPCWPPSISQERLTMQWIHGEKRITSKKSLKFRPAWVKKGQVSRLNGFHIFLQERKAQSEESIEGAADADVFLRQGSYDWSLLSAEAKKEYSDKAKAVNAEREAFKASDAPTMASLPGGPWNLSNLGSGESSSWPLRVDVMERFLETHGFEPIATEWVKD